MRKNQQQERAKVKEAKQAYLKEHWNDMSTDDLAVELGVCCNTVRGWAESLRLPPRKMTQRQKYRIAAVFPYATSGELQQLADELSISMEKLRTIARRLGLKKKLRNP
jgi:predicted ArsR family transcriptional regulator